MEMPAPLGAVRWMVACGGRPQPGSDLAVKAVLLKHCLDNAGNGSHRYFADVPVRCADHCGTHDAGTGEQRAVPMWTAVHRSARPPSTRIT
jgi:hypothetical protein